MAKLRSTLEAHKSALDIALDMAALSISREIKHDTTAIRADTEALRLGNAEILEEISKLQDILLQDAGPVPRTSYVLQRYLDSLTTYAESFAHGSEPALSEAEDFVPESEQRNVVDKKSRLGQDLSKQTSPIVALSGLQMRGKSPTVSMAAIASDPAESSSRPPAPHDAVDELHIFRDQPVAPSSSSHSELQDIRSNFSSPPNRNPWKDNSAIEDSIKDFTSSESREVSSSSVGTSQPLNQPLAHLQPEDMMAGVTSSILLSDNNNGVKCPEDLINDTSDRLRSILMKYPPPQDAGILRQALAILSYAVRPLSLFEFEMAMWMCTSPSTVENKSMFIHYTGHPKLTDARLSTKVKLSESRDTYGQQAMRLLRGLITTKSVPLMDGRNRIVLKFCHRYHKSMVASHLREDTILDACLLYLKTFADIHSRVFVPNPLGQIELGTRPENDIRIDDYPFLQYATEYWMQHAKHLLPRETKATSLKIFRTFAGSILWMTTTTFTAWRTIYHLMTFSNSSDTQVKANEYHILESTGLPRTFVECTAFFGLNEIVDPILKDVLQFSSQMEVEQLVIDGLKSPSQREGGQFMINEQLAAVVHAASQCKDAGYAFQIIQHIVTQHRQEAKGWVSSDYAVGALSQAIFRGNLSLVLLLLGEGVSPNYRGIISHKLQLAHNFPSQVAESSASSMACYELEICDEYGYPLEAFYGRPIVDENDAIGDILGHYGLDVQKVP
jgi:hypothetical protein